tara:strand:- start:196 stop:558 length:363 start_codon:yes stop_codon:yes gene_type:complete
MKLSRIKIRRLIESVINEQPVTDGSDRNPGALADKETTGALNSSIQGFADAIKSTKDFIVNAPSNAVDSINEFVQHVIAHQFGGIVILSSHFDELYGLYEKGDMEALNDKMEDYYRELEK